VANFSGSGVDLAHAREIHRLVVDAEAIAEYPGRSIPGFRGLDGALELAA
jgi:hypothetical protein